MMHGLLFASIVFLFQPLSLADATGEPVPEIERGPITVVLLPFEIVEHGSTEMAKSVPEELKQLLRKDLRFAVLSEDKGRSGSIQTAPSMPSADFLIAGSVYAGAGGRNFVALRIEDGETGETVWSENYDYTNISAEMMATSAFNALLGAIEAGNR